MSGPFDKPDDPDDVTLWAGRLRSWPTPPVDAHEDAAAPDATVIARRGRSGGVADDTVIARRRASRVRSSEEEGADEAIDGTASAVRPSRADDHPASQRPDAFDETVRSPRTVRQDDDTVPGRRAAVDRSPRSSPTPLVDDDTAPGARGARDVPPSQTSAASSLTGAVDDGPAAPRSARVPDPDADESYRPRSDHAVRVQRSALAPRVDRDRDAALVRARSPRRGVTAPLVIGGATIVVLLGALTAFLVLVR